MEIDTLLALDLNNMTEEEARKKSIMFLEQELVLYEAYGHRPWDFLFHLIFDTIFILIFKDSYISETHDNSLEAFLTKRTLKKFRDNKYKKSYISYLKKWQDQAKIQKQRDEALIKR